MNEYKPQYKYSDECFQRLKDYKNIMFYEKWAQFPEVMWDMGFEMDYEHGFEEYYKKYEHILKDTTSVRQKRKNYLYALEHADIQTVGNYLLSHWRYLTHWAQGSDDYEEAYLQRVLRMLIYKIEQSQK